MRTKSTARFSLCGQVTLIQFASWSGRHPVRSDAGNAIDILYHPGYSQVKSFFAEKRWYFKPFPVFLPGCFSIRRPAVATVSRARGRAGRGGIFHRRAGQGPGRREDFAGRGRQYRGVRQAGPTPHGGKAVRCRKFSQDAPAKRKHCGSLQSAASPGNFRQARRAGAGCTVEYGKPAQRSMAEIYQDAFFTPGIWPL